MPRVGDTELLQRTQQAVMDDWLAAAPKLCIQGAIDIAIDAVEAFFVALFF